MFINPAFFSCILRKILTSLIHVSGGCPPVVEVSSCWESVMKLSDNCIWSEDKYHKPDLESLWQSHISTHIITCYRIICEWFTDVVMATAAPSSSSLLLFIWFYTEWFIWLFTNICCFWHAIPHLPTRCPQCVTWHITCLQTCFSLLITPGFKTETFCGNSNWF